MGERFIGTVDVWTLRKLRWPFMRVFARRYVERSELCRVERELLASGAWAMVRCTPQAVGSHIFDVYGVPRVAT